MLEDAHHLVAQPLTHPHLQREVWRAGGEHRLPERDTQVTCDRHTWRVCESETHALHSGVQRERLRGFRV